MSEAQQHLSATAARPAAPAAGPAAGLDLLLDELAYGVAVTTPGGELLHANQAARHELARHQALWVQQGSLHAHSAADGRALHDALLRAADGKRTLLTLIAPEGTRLTLAAVPMGRSSNAGTAVGLLFARPAVCESLMLCFFARVHALTPTEEKVLGVLCQGHSAPQVARLLGVAVSTVRSHVRSLCAKTRTNSVRELVSKVATLPPVAPALMLEPTLH